MQSGDSMPLGVSIEDRQRLNDEVAENLKRRSGILLGKSMVRGNGTGGENFRKALHERLYNGATNGNGKH